MTSDEGLDDILNAVGYGLWQFPVFALTILTHLVIPVHMMGSALLSAPVDFRCSQVNHFIIDNINSTQVSHSSESDNSTSQETMSASYYNSKCLDPDLLKPPDEFLIAEATLEVTAHPTGLPSCPWVAYDKTLFSSTVISEWDLICEKEMLRPLFQMMYSIGAVFGSAIGGYVSDRFGRKKAVQIASFINLSGVVILYVIPWYTGALFARIILGGSCNFMVLPSYSLALEIAPPKYRTLVGMLLGTAFSVGIIIMAGLGFFIRSWKNLMILDAIVPFVFLIPLAFWVNESPRWLVQNDKPGEAARILTQAAVINKVHLDQTLADAIEGLREKSIRKRTVGANTRFSLRCIISWCQNYCQTSSIYLRSRALLLILIVSPIIWILHGCLYLGIILNANNFTSNNPFIYITVSGVMDLISILLATPLSMKLGRRFLIAGSFFIGGSLLIVDILVPRSLLWLKFILVMTALMLVAASFQVNFLYTPELYPTVIRARGFALSSLAGNIGFLVAPLITELLSTLSWWSVSVTFGCGGILASLLVPLLPETLHKPLPETLEDVEKRYRNALTSNIIHRENGTKTERGEDLVELEEEEECEVLNPS